MSWQPGSPSTGQSEDSYRTKLSSGLRYTLKKQLQVINTLETVWMEHIQQIIIDVSSSVNHEYYANRFRYS